MIKADHLIKDYDMLNLKSNKGYTYIELLGVIVIIALVVSPIIYMMGNILNKSLKSHTLNQANSVIISVMDRARYDVKSDGVNAVRTGDIDVTDYNYYNIPENYVVTLNILPVDGYSNILSLEVVLSVKKIILSMKSLVYYE